mgnify:CR=1 FL=1
MPPSSVKSLDEALAVASTCVWGLPLRPMQLRALLFLFGPANLGRKMLLVDRPGGGKSHVVRMIGTMLRGVHLVVHPLLALTADQVPNFRTGSERFGPISAHNLDELASGFSGKRYRSRLLKYLLGISPETSRTVYLFASPHFLATYHDVRNVLLNSSRRGVLRSVTLDEAHCYAKQGASFRPEICMLRGTLFSKLYPNTSAKRRTYLVCATAIDSKNDHRRLEHLTCSTFPEASRC